MSVGLTRHAPLRNPVGHICTGDQPLISDRAVFSPLVIRRSFAISPDIRLRPSRPRRYFPSFDRKRPITSMTTCGIVDHHDPFPRIFPPCSNPLPLQNDTKIGQTLSSRSFPSFHFHDVSFSREDKLDRASVVFFFSRFTSLFPAIERR